MTGEVRGAQAGLAGRPTGHGAPEHPRRETHAGPEAGERERKNKNRSVNAKLRPHHQGPGPTPGPRPLPAPGRGCPPDFFQLSKIPYSVLWSFFLLGIISKFTYVRICITRSITAGTVIVERNDEFSVILRQPLCCYIHLKVQNL